MPVAMRYKKGAAGRRPKPRKRKLPGMSLHGHGVAVSVDGQGQFFTLVQLEPGSNIINVIARSADGQSLRSTISVIFTPQ